MDVSLFETVEPFFYLILILLLLIIIIIIVVIIIIIQVKIGHYILGETLGIGTFGKVRYNI